ncbi:hypothetical protein KGY73_01255 [bacterium]|nr:hypothetical protein [bacterium]
MGKTKQRIKFVLSDSFLFLTIGGIGYIIIQLLKLLVESEQHTKILETLHFGWLLLVVVIFLLDSLIRIALSTYLELHQDYSIDIKKFSVEAKPNQKKNQKKSSSQEKSVDESC